MNNVFRFYSWRPTAKERLGKAGAARIVSVAVGSCLRAC